MTDRIVYLNSELFYYKEGTGSKTILLFHGFGQDHRVFENWIEVLRDEYTIYTFDLYFHGNSNWTNPWALKKEDWKKILQLFFVQEKIDSFYIAGFSIGAKFVLATPELFPEQVKKIILIAPDGITTNVWYTLATSTSFMRALFRSMTLRPKRLQALIEFLRFFHFEDQSLLRFAASQVNTEERRQRVYRSWVYFRHLNCNLKELSLLLNSKNIPVTFIVGKTDNVISAERIIGFARTLYNCQIEILNAAHNDLITKGIDFIM